MAPLGLANALTPLTRALSTHCQRFQIGQLSLSITFVREDAVLTTRSVFHILTMDQKLVIPVIVQEFLLFLLSL